MNLKTVAISAAAFIAGALASKIYWVPSQSIQAIGPWGGRQPPTIFVPIVRPTPSVIPEPVAAPSFTMVTDAPTSGPRPAPVTHRIFGLSDEEVLISDELKNQILTWNVRNQSPVTAWQLNGSPKAMGFDFSGKTLLVSLQPSQTVAKITLGIPEVKIFPVEHPVFSIANGPSGSFLVWWNTSPEGYLSRGELVTFEAESGRTKTVSGKDFRQPDGREAVLGYNPKNSDLLTSDNLMPATVIQYSRGQDSTYSSPTHTLSRSLGQIAQIVFSPNYERVTLFESGSLSVKEFDSKNVGVSLGEWNVPHGAGAFAYSPDGKTVAILTGRYGGPSGETLGLYDPTTRVLRGSLTVGGQHCSGNAVESLAFSPSSNTVFLYRDCVSSISPEHTTSLQSWSLPK